MRRFSITHLFLFCLLIICFACNKESDLDPSFFSSSHECNLTLEEAQKIFLTSPFSNNDLALNEFQLGMGHLDLDWNTAVGIYDIQNANDNYEIRFQPQYQILFYEIGRNGRRFFLENDKRILLIQNRETGLSCAFVMIMVADASYSKKHRRVELYQLFHNDGQFRDFSGIIIYTTLDGYIVRVNRYKEGNLVSGVLMSGARSDDEFKERILFLKKTMGQVFFTRRPLFLRTRSDSDSLDANFGWPFNDSLDPAICVADTNDFVDSTLTWPDPWGDPWGGSGGGGWNGFPDPGPDPGSGQYGGGGIDHFPTVPDFEQSVVIAGKQVVVHFENESLVPVFSGKLSQLNSISIFQKIALQLDFSKIPIYVKYADFFDTSVSGLTHITKVCVGGSFQRYDCWIDLNADGLLLGYLEEFFHALQYTSSTQEIMSGDVEFEAKVMLAKYLDTLSDYERQQMLTLNPEIKDNIDLFTDFLHYVENPSEAGRCEALLAFSRLGYVGFPMSEDASNLQQILTRYLWLFNDN